MFILNITFKTTWAIYDTWLPWLKENCLPKVTASVPHDQLVLRLLDVDESDGPTIAVQVKVVSALDLEAVEQQWLTDGMALVHRVWGNECVHFATKMEVVP